MIESERVKERITEDIVCWCERTGIKSCLRDYDIPDLVSTILDEFYHVRLSCGHLVKETSKGLNLAFKDMVYDGGESVEGEVHGIYCIDCAKKYKKELGAWEV